MFLDHEKDPFYNATEKWYQYAGQRKTASQTFSEEAAQKLHKKRIRRPHDMLRMCENAGRKGIRDQILSRRNIETGEFKED